jgi:hypothetical protein
LLALASFVITVTESVLFVSFIATLPSHVCARVIDVGASKKFASKPMLNRPSGQIINIKLPIQNQKLSEDADNHQNTRWLPRLLLHSA